MGNTGTQDSGGPPGILWLHQRPIAIPSGIWTPLPFNQVGLDNQGVNPYGSVGGLIPVSTTIAAASNGAVLPQATINTAAFTVDPAGKTGFLPAGYLVITAPPGAGTDTIVSYTGANGAAGTFTGCNSDHNGAISTGTLATGQTVTQAFCAFNLPNSTAALYQLNLAAEFAASATGYRGIRAASPVSPFFFVSATNHCPATGAVQNVNVSTQPIGTAGAAGLWPFTNPGIRIEVFQNSGAVLNVNEDSLQSPCVQAIAWVHA